MTRSQVSQAIPSTASSMDCTSALSSTLSTMLRLHVDDAPLAVRKVHKSAAPRPSCCMVAACCASAKALSRLHRDLGFGLALHAVLFPCSWLARAGQTPWPRCFLCGAACFCSTDIRRRSTLQVASEPRKILLRTERPETIGLGCIQRA